MANVEYWIQLENRPWDTCPGNIDRMTGLSVKDRTGKDPVHVTLTSPGSGVTRNNVTMFAPLRDSDGAVTDALILRRYKPPAKKDLSDAWTVPDDRKINPWDLNERDPSDNGTMGTIPGPVIEANVGDAITVHFRNLDNRTKIEIQNVCFPVGPFGQICLPIPVPVPLPIENRIHSLHPHGVVFTNVSDGAYPLSPPDPAQVIPPAETAAWSSVPGFAGKLKQGDRVPPGGTYDYHWNTFGWPSTAGVWLYHDHSICDMPNVERGAIGIIVIHNPADTLQEVDIRAGDPNDPSKLDPAFLPGGSAIGSPRTVNCLPFGDINIGILPGQLGMLGLTEAEHALAHGAGPHTPESLKVDQTIHVGDGFLELDEKLLKVARFCLPVFRTPPEKALFVQLFHSLQGAPGMCINGRTFLGNTPTLVAGVQTRMRFGVVGMGSDFHTFHLHGHRWVIPGPDGNTPSAIQSSAQVRAVSQFEDTRTFGPANSFVFTIDEKSGSFMRAGSPSPADARGEWHMHCHVLSHMMIGMMGSLLIINGGELSFGLPKGVPCPDDMAGMGGMGGMNGGNGNQPATHTVNVQFPNFSSPSAPPVKVGDTVQFKNLDNFEHTVVWDTGGAPANSPAGALVGGATWPVVMNSAGTFNYHCSIHPNMTSSITVTA